MKLLTKEILQKLPVIHSTELLSPDKTPIVVKFFTPDAQWTWYATEASTVDAEGEEHPATWRPGPGEPALVDFLFFGLVIGLEKEFGYFSLSELVKVRGKLGLPIERDRHFGHPSMAEIMVKEGL
jgi:hypothetical protein